MIDSNSVMATGPEESRQRGQQGASLVIAMIVLVVLSTIVLALASFARTAVKATSPYASSQTKRYAADSGLKAAINYVAKSTNLGRDSATFPNDPACGYRVPASETGSIDVTVTCAAVTGSKSGVPAESGKVPDQAILLLGQRYGELPLFSPCTGSTTDRRDTRGREVGLLLDPIALQKVSGTPTCVENKGAIDSIQGFTVNGSIKSNGPIRVAPTARLNVTGGGTITAGTSPAFYLNNSAPTACLGNISVACTMLPTARSRSLSDQGGIDPFDPVETLATDPALDGSRGSDWRQGTINWSDPKVSFNGATPVALTDTTTINCSKSQNIIRFYPGFYTSATALNRLFGNASCAAGTDGLHPGIFWFGPAENGTRNDSPSTFSLALFSSTTTQQGVYTFDFRDTGTGSACAVLANTNNPHRWCLKPNADTDGGPILVGGWPKGFDPQGVVNTPTSSPGNSFTTSLTAATTVNTDGSQSWTTPDNAKTYNDSSVAIYKPTVGTSTNRSIVLSGFGTVGAVQANGKISFSVRHQESNAAKLAVPKLTLTTSDRGVPVSCGSFTVPKSSLPSTWPNADGLKTNIVSTDPSDDPTVVLTAADRSNLRSCFVNSDRIKNLQFKWEVGGDTFNAGTCPTPFGLDFLAPVTCPGSDNATKPRVFLDGIQITVEVPTGGFFDTGAALPATYCDSTKPGVQFIFGGDSTVHTGTAAMQLCAGPAPSNPENYQQIAVWGQPVNFLTKDNGTGGQTETRVGKTGSTSLTPTAVSQLSSSCTFICFNSPSWSNTSRGVKPGKQYTDPAIPSEPLKAELAAGNSVSTSGGLAFTGFGKLASYSSSDCSVANSGRNICYDPGGTVVTRVVLKAGYGTDCAVVLFCGPLAADVDYTIGNGATDWCSRTFPATGTVGWFSSDVWTACFGGTSSTAISRLNDPNLRVTMKFGCTFCVNNKKRIEGIELLVNWKGVNNVVAPASGCRLSQMGYGSGVGDYADTTQANYVSATQGTDCALISGAPPVVDGTGTVTRPGGRVSIQGTIYAPNDALEIADGDVMYPYASRGIVARHLRVRGMQYRPGYEDASIAGAVDKAPNDRQVELTACLRTTTNVTAACGTTSGDVILARAGVRFTIDTRTPTTPPAERTKKPIVLWWNSEAS